MRNKKQTKSNDITILQCNLNKNRTITHSILNDKISMKFTILALQEHYWSKNTKEPFTHHSWTMIQSSTPTKGQPRSAIYVNNNALPASNFEPVNIPLNDITAIKIRTHEDKPTLIINIYKPCNQHLITLLRQYLTTNINTEDYGTIIILGDFNLHHGLWNPRSYTNSDAQADELIETMAELGMELMLPDETITFPRAGTTIDLVWGNKRAMEAVVKCKVSTHNDHTSDHLAIETSLNLQIPKEEQIQRPFNYEKTDWKNMEQILPTHATSPGSRRSN
jgi:exonuclease III